VGAAVAAVVGAAGAAAAEVGVCRYLRSMVGI